MEECEAGGGNNGTATLKDLSQTVGVPITAPQVDTRIGRTPKCTKTAYPSGKIETSGVCDSGLCLKKPRK